MKSAVAGIVDKKGGMRVVVTQQWRMKYHVRKGERLFVVPDFKVKEPVPFDDIPPLIAKTQEHVAKTLAPINHCGSCKLCCVLHRIDDPELQKPAFQPCHNLCSAGCKIYWRRPKACVGFKCEWLKSQSRNDRMAQELRPDKCGAYFCEDTLNNDSLIIEVHGEPNSTAWTWINEMQRVGYKAKKITHYVGDKE